MAVKITQDDQQTYKSKFNLRVWGKILKYTLNQWPLLIVLFLTIFLTSFYDVTFIPLMNASAISALSKLTAVIDLSELYFDITILGITIEHFSFTAYILALFIGIIIRSVAIFFTFFITNYLEMSIMTSLRRDSFKVVQELSFSYFDNTPSGWLISRMQNDTATIGDVLSWGIIRILWISVELILTLITMFTANWLLSLIILSMAPVIFVFVAYFNTIILKRHRIARNAYSNFVRWLAECISGVATIKTLAIEDKVYEEENEITEDVRSKRLKAFIPNAFFTPIFSILSAITTALIILTGAYIYGPSVIDVATLVLFIGFVGQIYNPLSQFSELYAEFVSTQANIEKIMSLIETKPTIVDKKEVVEKYGDIFNNKSENFEKLQGDIIYNHVSFSYKENIEVLHDLYLHIENGTSLAIVGETGSGKSTTVNLLCRFYEPSKGEILIDGVNYKERSLGWLRSNIGYVQQTPFVFSTSFKNNVKYGKLDASDEEVINACKIVGIHDFIMSFKDGYDTVLNDSGNQLSLGQKQLISFARAIIRNPAIMILDEATSSIDTETEKQIQDAMNKILKGRTSLIIAHRLSTIVDCDRILVMKDGKVVEDGNHIQLMKNKGYYYQLYMNQFKQLNLGDQLKTYEEQITKKGLE